MNTSYTYTFGDPVNTTDPTGAYVECTYCTEHFDQLNQEAVEQENARIAAREAAARAAAEKAAQEAAEAAALAGPQYAGEEEWEEWKNGKKAATNTSPITRAGRLVKKATLNRPSWSNV